jgi:cation:H+ antiporter
MFDSVSDLLFVVAMVAGLATTLFASRKAVGHARLLAEATAVSPFIVGITLFAIGTDLPEIANSVVASITDHGDINVGDSVGSAVTQITLVLGLLPLVVGAFVVGRGRVGRTGVVTVGALLLAALLFSDGHFSRFDSLVLISAWVGGSIFIWRGTPPAAEPVMQIPARKATRHALIALAMLGLVGAGAGAAVWGLIGIAESLEVPEYTLAFVVAAIGTSLPELVVDITALRAGATDLAVGDVFGSSFVDSTLSMAVGPLLAPTAITASLAVRGALIGAGMVFSAALLLTISRRHNRITGVVCIGLWLLAYVLLIG